MELVLNCESIATELVIKKGRKPLMRITTKVSNIDDLLENEELKDLFHDEMDVAEAVGRFGRIALLEELKRRDLK